MKTIIRPRKRVLNMKTKCVRLWFDPDRSIAPDGFYRMLGGMYFPSQVVTADGGTRNVGYAMMTGTHVDSKTMYVFDEIEWYFVDHILAPGDGAIVHEGLLTWYNEIWSHYFCSVYAIRQDDETAFRYALDFGKCRSIQPKPAFDDAEWDDPMQPMYIIDRMNQLGRIKFMASGCLYQQLEERKVDPDRDKHDYPAVHAMQCVAMVMDRFYSR